MNYHKWTMNYRKYKNVIYGHSRSHSWTFVLKPNMNYHKWTMNYRKHKNVIYGHSRSHSWTFVLKDKHELP